MAFETTKRNKYTRVTINNGLLRTWDCLGKFIYLVKKRKTVARSLTRKKSCYYCDG